jgi:ABC-2 type transport system permease protein
MSAWQLVTIILWKEWLELRNAKILRRFLIVFPIVLVLQTTLFIAPAAIVRLPSAARDQILRIDPTLAGLPDGKLLQTVYARRIALFILIVPMTIGIQIGAFAFAGEKAGRTLEPLLATPVSTDRLLLAKMLSGLIPAILIGFLLEGLFIVLLRFLVGNWDVAGAVLTPAFHFLSLIGSPFLAFIGVCAAVIASARTDEPRLVVQFANLVVLPVLAGCIAFVFLKGVYLDIKLVTLSLIVAATVSVSGLWLSVRLFQREKILSR